MATRSRNTRQTRDSKTDQAVRKTRELLFRRFNPGEIISEADIQQQLGPAFSRMPVRYALAILEREGLIEIKAQQGAVVLNLTEKDVAEIHNARLVNELGCVDELARAFADYKEAPKLTLQPDLRALHAIAKQMRAIAKKRKQSAGDKERFTDLDLEFHCQLAVLAGYPTTICSFLMQLRNRFRVFAEPSRRSFTMETVGEHNQIIHAIESGNTNAAREAMRSHLDKARERWEERKAERRMLGF